MDDVKNIKLELDRKVRILKQLEGVYKTSPSIGQRKRVFKEIQEIKRAIKDLQRQHESMGAHLQNENSEAQGVTGTTIMGRMSAYTGGNAACRCPT